MVLQHLINIVSLFRSSLGICFQTVIATGNILRKFFFFFFKSAAFSHHIFLYIITSSCGFCIMRIAVLFISTKLRRDRNNHRYTFYCFTFLICVPPFGGYFRVDFNWYIPCSNLGNVTE